MHSYFVSFSLLSKFELFEIYHLFYCCMEYIGLLATETNPLNKN